MGNRDLDCLNYTALVKSNLEFSSKSLRKVMTVPANLLVDMYLRGTEFSTFEVIGTVMAVLALVILLIPQPEKRKNSQEVENEKFIVKE